MKSTYVRIAGIACAAVLMTACASDANDQLSGKADESAVYADGVAGGVATRVMRITATVKSIDYKTRKVTLEDDKGNKKTLTVGPEAINFDQVKKGDQVNVEYMEQLVVFMKAKGTPDSDGIAMLAGRAPEGNKPAVVMGGTVEMTAVVKELDLENHTATLQFPTGDLQVFPVRQDVVLKKDMIGKEVVFQATTAVALTVEKR
ncbi:MAG TPA: hypothetical protein VIM96_11225 [Pseudomonadales bacterium]